MDTLVQGTCECPTYRGILSMLKQCIIMWSNLMHKMVAVYKLQNCGQRGENLPKFIIETKNYFSIPQGTTVIHIIICKCTVCILYLLAYV